jgi:hypothetical protein
VQKGDPVIDSTIQQTDLPRRFGPKTVDHPSVGNECVLCDQKFAAGDYTTLMPIGPDPDNKEAVRAFLVGKPYNSRAVEIHWDCLRVILGDA